MTEGDKIGLTLPTKDELFQSVSTKNSQNFTAPSNSGLILNPNGLDIDVEARKKGFLR